MFHILVLWMCSIAAVLFVLDFILRNYTTYGIAKSMPGPSMYPIIGAVYFFLSPQDKTFEITIELCKKFKNGFIYWSFGYFIYTIYSADSFEKVVTNSKNNEKSFSYRYLHMLLGTGLLTSAGEKWFQRRKLLTPAFHFNVLNGFQTTFNEQTKILLQEIRKNELNKAEGTHLQKLMSRFTLNTICESAMGVNITAINALDDYRAKINEIGKYQVERLTVPWLGTDFLYFIFGKGKRERKAVKQAHTFTGNVIESKRKKFIQQIEERAHNNKRAMLDILLEAEQKHNSIDSIGIQEEVDTFVFEGFDTTMTAITFTLLAIANHEDVQKRLYEEISESIQDGQQGYNNLKYLDCVIKESLRLYPPVPFIGRALGEDTVLDGHKLPAKTMIHILIYYLHRDPKYFPEPEKFDPNRFLENETKHPFAYVPFSAGQRNCIGQKFAMMERAKVRTVIGEIIKNFEIKPITKPEDVVIIADIILRSKNPIRVKFVPRGSAM